MCEGREGGEGGDWTIVLIMKVPALIHLEIQHMDRNTSLAVQSSPVLTLPSANKEKIMRKHGVEFC